MCLTIAKKNRSILTKPLQAVVYKYYILSKVVKGEDKTEYLITAPYRHTKYKVGEGDSIVSNRKTKRLTRGERECGTVHEGLHVLKRPGDAIANASQCAILRNSRAIVIQMVVNPNDRVAGGFWSTSSQEESEVYSKVEVNKVVAIISRRGNVVKI